MEENVQSVKLLMDLKVKLLSTKKCLILLELVKDEVCIPLIDTEKDRYLLSYLFWQWQNGIYFLDCVKYTHIAQPGASVSLKKEQLVIFSGGHSNIESPESSEGGCKTSV